MSAWVVFLKEVTDNLRDRRTLMSALIFGPVFGPVLFGYLMYFVINEKMDDVAKPLPISVIGGEFAPELLDQLRMNGIEIKPASSEPEALLAEDSETPVLVIPSDIYTAFRNGEAAMLRIFHDSANDKSSQRVSRLESALDAWGRKIAYLRLQLRGIAPDVIKPVSIEKVDIATESSRSALIFGMLPYFVLLSGILGCFYLAIDATAGERERGSLESLLSLPVPRQHLVIGKVLAATVFSAVSLALCVIIFALAMPYVGLETIGMSSVIRFKQVLAILAVSVPFAFFAAGLLTLVASFAKSYKEAQTYLSIVMLVPLIPVIIGSIVKPEISLKGALIPGFSQHLLIIEIIKGVEVSGHYLLASAGSTLILGALLSAGAIGLYRSERILG